MYRIFFYLFTLTTGIISQSNAKITCENYVGAEPCILCEKCAEKNNKIDSDSLCKSMTKYLNDSLEINDKNIERSCYKYGYESELMKHRSVYYQQRVSILPPKTGFCYFNISYNHFLNDTPHTEDILYIGGQMDSISHWWNTLKTCSENKKWDVQHMPWKQTKPGDRHWRFRYLINHIETVGM